ncbi:hypothetical protein [Actinomycetospora sp. NBRC 106378]|uniref:hypothetical protein n=1 Tax=Actinomycetospora sp. NBRC 106378 TaxID=3032208 RepID=UPI0024A48A42|nr:hypothetical protein [Actinomycetospora sp. NBRC 106378]GLZ51676.1 hypothetical protein Acsp07_12930 [Actinomycetospora sp. NBRC 106378]
MTFLLTWNPAKWAYEGDEYKRHVQQTSGPHPKPVEDHWSTGSRTKVELGERVFLLRQGADRPGVVAMGRVNSDARLEPHWDAERAAAGETAHFVDVVWDRVLDIDDRVPTAELEAEVGSVHWHPQGGGTSLTDEQAAAVEALVQRGEPLGGGHSTMAAEASEDAVDLLRRLLGLELRDRDGRLLLRIQAVSPAMVQVSVNDRELRSMGLTPFEEALAQLGEGESIDVAAGRGWQAALLRAALLTVPGVRVVGGQIVLGRPRADADVDGRTVGYNEFFDVTRPLDRAAVALQRGEQAALRAGLFSTRSHGRCALCRRTYPVQFLRAAHIKPRSVCSEDEKRDLTNIAMAACVFGCDALFEVGFLGVDDTGTVVASGGAMTDAAIASYLDPVVGGRCLAFRPPSNGYFAWHRDNIFRAGAVCPDERSCSP